MFCITRRKIFLAAGAAVVHASILAVPLIVLGKVQFILLNREILLFFIIITLWLVVESCLCPIRLPGSRFSQNTFKQRLFPALTGCLFLFVFWVSVAEHAFFPGKQILFLSISGCVLMVSGILLRCLAINTLGAYFLDEITLEEDHRLVTKGIYRLIRHPSELGNIFIVTGSVLLLLSRAGACVGFFLLLPLIIWRTRYEDRLLKQRFPRLFAEYAGTTGAFFPFLPR